METCPPEFFATHVKSLCCANFISAADVAQILSVCTGITRLACWITIPNYGMEGKRLSLLSTAILSRLPQRLSMHLRVLTFPNDDPSFRFATLRSLTHLSVRDPLSTWIKWSWNGIENLSALSFLSLDARGFQVRYEDAMSRVICRVLSSCVNLRACVLMIQPLLESERRSTSEGDRDYIRRVGRGDPRLVARIPPDYFMDWEAHSNGCDDIWDIAERIAECEKRKRCASS